MSAANNPFGEAAPLVDLDELRTWILQDDDDLLIVNKPGWLVCHPSKNGPLSSLVGAVRELTGVEKLHLVARLDRETSGLVIFAKRPAMARKYQMAIQDRIVDKTYVAILKGELAEPVRVDQSIARRKHGLVHVKNEVSYVRGAQTAVTLFTPIACAGGFTLARVEPETGRKHQIRVHAEWLDHQVVGDKIYGPDESLYVEFIERGWTERLASALPLKRQALHCYQYRFDFPSGAESFVAPVQSDLIEFCAKYMGLDLAELDLSADSV